MYAEAKATLLAYDSQEEPKHLQLNTLHLTCYANVGALIVIGVTIFHVDCGFVLS